MIDPATNPNVIAAIERLAKNLETLGEKFTRDAKPALTAAATAGLLTVILRKAIKDQPIGSLLITTIVGYKLGGYGIRGAPIPYEANTKQLNPLLAGMGKAAFHLILDGLTAMSLADKFKPHN